MTISSMHAEHMYIYLYTILLFPFRFKDVHTRRNIEHTVARGRKRKNKSVFVVVVVVFDGERVHRNKAQRKILKKSVLGKGCCFAIQHCSKVEAYLHFSNETEDEEREKKTPKWRASEYHM